MPLDTVNCIIRGIALTVGFGVLVYLFRDRVTFEGVVGYIVVLFLLIPLNVVLGDTESVPGLDVDLHRLLPVALLLLNTAALLVLNKLTPGLSATSPGMLLLFSLLLSALSLALQWMPRVPAI